MTGDPVNEAQLHAYVDGALNEGERAAVEAHLAANPDDAARVRAYQAQNEALQRAFDPVLDEPHTLRIGVPRRRAVPAPTRWGWAAALAATFAGGVIIGALSQSFWSGDRPLAGTVAIAHQAALAYAAYKPEVRHPVEVGASDEQHLVAWLSKRLDAPVRAPALVAEGWQLLGGRLLPPAGEAGAAPVALFMYEDARGKRLTLLVRREPGGGDTAFRFAQDGATNVFYWIDGPLGYALAGEVGKDQLSAIAQAVYRQLNP
jgi:anti-sigma factor RsiW